MVFLIKNQERCRRVDPSVKDVMAGEGCWTIDTHQLGKAWKTLPMGTTTFAQTQGPLAPRESLSDFGQWYKCSIWNRKAEKNGPNSTHWGRTPPLQSQHRNRKVGEAFAISVPLVSKSRRLFYTCDIFCGTGISTRGDFL